LPHVVIAGPIDLEAYARAFEPIVVRVGRDVLRADDLYLERGGRALLIEALAVEAGRRMPFYIKVSAHDRGSATVRIDPLTHPERSDGVKRLVAEVGADLLRLSPGTRLDVTNLVVPSRETGASEAGSGGPDRPRGRSARSAADGAEE